MILVTKETVGKYLQTDDTEINGAKTRNHLLPILESTQIRSYSDLKMT